MLFLTLRSTVSLPGNKRCCLFRPRLELHCKCIKSSRGKKPSPSRIMLMRFSPARHSFCITCQLVCSHLSIGLCACAPPSSFTDSLRVCVCVWVCVCVCVCVRKSMSMFCKAVVINASRYRPDKWALLSLSLSLYRPIGCSPVGCWPSCINSEAVIW